jgi:hypothetical protein
MPIMLWHEAERLVAKQRWLDPTGGPAMLLPSCYRRYWNGIWLPCVDDETCGDETNPPLVLRNGKRFYSDTTFDFSRPRTDYDRLCSGRENDELYLHPVASGNALVIGHGGEHYIGWSPAERLLLITGWAGWNPELPIPGASPSAISHDQQELPEPTHLDGIRWSEELVWHLPSSVFYLMASSLHGLEPDLKPDFKNRMWVRCRLRPGVYRVLSGRCGRAGPPCLYRLVPASKMGKRRGARRRSTGKHSR